MLKVVYWMECRNVGSSVLDGMYQFMKLVLFPT